MSPKHVNNAYKLCMNIIKSTACSNYLIWAIGRSKMYLIYCTNGPLCTFLQTIAYNIPAIVLLIIHVCGKRCTISRSEQVDNASSVTGLLAIHIQMCFSGEGVLFMSQY